jgi:hypothetical protein
MTRCLTRREIFDVFEGDGRAAARVHVATCGACRARLTELEVAVAEASSAIAEEPLSDVARRRPKIRRLALPLAAAVALAVGLSQWWQPSSRLSDRPSAARIPVEDPALSLAELSSALAGADAVQGWPSPDSEVAYLGAALDGRWPCEERGMTIDVRCN